MRIDGGGGGGGYEKLRISIVEGVVVNSAETD